MYIDLWCIITVSKTLQRKKTVNRISWCKGINNCFKICYRAKYNLKPIKMFIVVI